jgi:periplasmic protein TonB
MKKLFLLFSLFYTYSLTGQKVYLDEYKASIVKPTKAEYYVVTDYENNSSSFKETTFYITGEKESENNYLKSTGEDATWFIWYLGSQSGKFSKDAKSLRWYKNGQPESEEIFINGKRNGKAIEWYENGLLKSEKNYVNNKLEGKSSVWYENGQLKSESNYINNQLNGALISYWKKGEKKREDVYREGKFENGTCYDSLGKEMNHYDFEVMPEYSGGDRQILNDIANNLKYPIRSRDFGIQGRVIVRFAINEDGKISNIGILSGVNAELNKEAVRVVGTLKNFKPAYLDGEPFKFYFMVPITFTLR